VVENIEHDDLVGVDECRGGLAQKFLPVPIDRVPQIEVIRLIRYRPAIVDLHDLATSPLAATDRQPIYERIEIVVARA
jgi:hypothetical protein